VCAIKETIKKPYRRRYLQIIYLIKYLYLQYIKNNPIIKIEITHLKTREGFEQTFLQRRHIAKKNMKISNINSAQGNRNQSHGKIPFHTHKEECNQKHR
jgi:hypothetical protein